MINHPFDPFKDRAPTTDEYLEAKEAWDNRGPQNENGIRYFSKHRMVPGYVLTSWRRWGQ